MTEYKKYFRIFFGVLTVTCMLAIFKFSSQGGTESSQVSGKITQEAVIIINELGGNIDTDPGGAGFQQVNYLLRKTAHFSVFLLLSISFTAFLICCELKMKKTAALNLLFCFAYACSDEFHQIFSSGRSPRFFDVFIDLSGAVTGMLSVFLLYFILKKILTKST